MDYTFLTGMREGKFVPPPWLAHLAGDAQVELNCLRVLQAFVAPDDGGTDLKSLIKSTTGDLLSTIGSISFTTGSIMSTTLGSTFGLAWYIIRLLAALKPKGVVFSRSLFLSFFSVAFSTGNIRLSAAAPAGQLWR